jgi:hypothetical protein
MKGSFVNLNPLFNANGDISTLGFQFVIDTLSAIQARVVEQKFYTVAPADFFAVDVGQEAWSDEIVQNLSFQLGGNFFDGDIGQGTGNGNLASVDAGVGQVRMPTAIWAKSTPYTLPELKQAVRSDNWDPITAKLRSLKTNWDHGIQEVMFMGHPATPALTGLLNDAEVNINTTLITKSISSMTAAELSTLIAGLLAAFWANSNNTAMPDTFVIPTNDYLGLGVPYSDAYPNISRLEYLTNMFQKMTGNPGAKILPLAYAQATNPVNVARGISKNRYVLYRNEADTLTGNIPVDYTQLPQENVNGIFYNQQAYGQYSGCLIARKREVLYLDDAP